MKTSPLSKAPASKAIKRSIDVAGSMVLLAAVFPICTIIAVAICAESKGGAFFRQARIGKECKPFSILKFRTMVANAPALGPHWTSDNDPRITRLGLLLRRASLDELPQLWNVLKGDMSLIGPRPDTPAQEHDYLPHHWQLRHRVRPGISGLAQVSGRSNLSIRRRLACDLYYVRHANTVLDIRIAMATLCAVISRKGTN
jgi:lipopolysaccharide/colanic/teichoic acid biosynthesis glycosyltransferase